MTNIDELLKRLRERATQTEWSSFLKGSKRNLASEAADALTTLQSENDELRDGLRKLGQVSLRAEEAREHAERKCAELRQELEEARRDAERLDWVSAQLDEMGSVWFLPSGEELRFVQVRHCGHTANFPTVAGLRAAIDAARTQTS